MVLFGWGQAEAARLAAESDIVVVVDVLSFTTTVCAAADRGVGVVPVAWADAENAGVPARLSPQALGALQSGQRLELASPNGGACVLAASRVHPAPVVVAGSLRNATAVAGWVVAHGGAASVVAAGERWPDGRLRPALEDLLGAGAILAPLIEGWPPVAEAPEVHGALTAFRTAAASGRLVATLRACASGQELRARGFCADVDDAAELDVSRCVPALQGGVFVDAR